MLEAAPAPFYTRFADLLILPYRANCRLSPVCPTFRVFHRLRLGLLRGTTIVLSLPLILAASVLLIHRRGLDPLSLLVAVLLYL